MANKEHVRILVSGVEVREANLYGANRNGPNLSKAHLIEANLTRGDLSGADLSEAHLLGTSFADVSLAGIKGIHTARHGGPSPTSVGTLERTAADLGKDASGQRTIEIFLKWTGVPEDYIDFFRSRIGKPIQFYSCFISYSTKDQEFADRLYADLQSKNIRCWLATEDLKIGDKFRTRITDAIRVHDQLLVALS